MHGSKVWGALALLGSVVALASTGVAGCGGDSNGSGGGGHNGTGGHNNTGGSGGGGPEGSGHVKSGKRASDSALFDATLSDDGSLIYFTGLSSKGDGAVFSVPAGGGAATPIVQSGLVAPFGIALSADGKTLFVADPAAETKSEDGGSIFAVTAEGGSLSAISASAGAVPRSLDVLDEGGKSTIYFSGSVKGVPGVYKLAASGGAIQSVASGKDFVDPAGLAVASDGSVYVLDTVGGSLHDATGLAIDKNGKVSTLLNHASVGYPAGLALAQDESAVLVSGLDAAYGHASVLRVDIKSHEVEKFPSDTKSGLGSLFEPAGLHRARNRDIYAWVLADASQGGVFLLK